MKFDDLYEELLGEDINVHGVNVGDICYGGEGIVFNIVRKQNVDDVYGSVMRVDVASYDQQVLDTIDFENVDEITPEKIANACAEVAQEAWSVYFDRDGNIIEDVGAAIAKAEQAKITRDAYRGHDLEDLIDL